MNIIRVCTFNVRLKCNEEDENNNWDKRLPRIKAQLDVIKPDLFGCQEARLVQFDAMKEIMQGYDSEFLPRDGERDEGTPVFYRTDKFDLVSKGSYYLNEHPDTPGIGWDACCLRVASYVTLIEKATGKKFTYFNTHLDHRGKQAQINGINLMVKKMSEIGGSMILTGDFNVFPDSETYNVAASLLKDTKKLAKLVHGEETFHHYGDETKKGMPPIDYVFVSDDIKVHSYVVYDKIEESGCASDHYALYSDITL